MMGTGHTHIIDPEYYERVRKELEDSLEEDEIICNKCDGTGSDPEYDSPWLVCPKCQGKKKLDWIEAATGVAPVEGLWSSSFTNGTAGTSGLFTTSGHAYNIIPSSNMYPNGHTHVNLGPNSLCIDDCVIKGKPVTQYIQEVVSKALAKKIDEQIMSCLKKVMEQKPKKNKKTNWEGIFW